MRGETWNYLKKVAKKKMKNEFFEEGSKYLI